MKTVDLNADMGESFGDWRLGQDEALMNIVSSANIACGFHAGDPDVMARTMRLAAARGIGIGAHPGFPDLQGFGRRRIEIPAGTLANMIRYQLGAALAMARAAGGTVRHFKLHGALSNMAAADPDLARTCFAAAREIAPDIILVVLAATPMEAAARALGGPWAGEIFADRAYNADASLVDRRQPGAVIHNAADAARRMRAMIGAGAILTADGTHIPARIDTICVHGDTPEAVEIARAVRAGLETDGLIIAPFGG